MIEYRMVIFKSGLIWQSHDISAVDDEIAKDLAQQHFDKLATERRRQGAPRALERFILYDGVRVVCEVVAH
jgi:hypothetical protein